MFYISILLCLLVAGTLGFDYVLYPDVVRSGAGLAAALVAGGSALLGGIANLVSQSDTNAANERIAAENRDWQSGENQLSRDWQERLWNLENQYNTPSAQSVRLKEAGINPYLIGAGVDAGNAGSAGSPSMQSAPNMPNIQSPDYSFIGDAASKSIGAYYNAQSINAQSANQTSQAERSYIESAKEIQRLYGREVAQKYLQGRLREIRGIESQDSYYSRLWDNQLKQSEFKTQIESVNAEVARKYGVRTAETILSVQEQTFNKMAAEIGLMHSGAEMNRSNIALNKSRAKDLAASYIERMANAYKLKEEGRKYSVDSETASRIMDSYVRMVQINADVASMDKATKSAFFNGMSQVRESLNRGEFDLKFLENFENSNDPNLVNLGLWLGAFGQVFSSSFNVSESHKSK